MSGSLPNSQQFKNAAQPSETVIEAQFSEKRIVMGPAYVIDDGLEAWLSETPHDVPVSPALIEEEVIKLHNAIKKTIALYVENYKASECLDEEFRDTTRQALRAEIGLLVALEQGTDTCVPMKNPDGSYILRSDFLNLEISIKKQGITAPRAIYQTLSNNIKIFNTLVAPLEASITPDTDPQVKKNTLAAIRNQRFIIDALTHMRMLMLCFAQNKDLPPSIAAAPEGSIPVMNLMPIQDIHHFLTADGFARHPAMIVSSGTPTDHATIVAKGFGVVTSRCTPEQRKTIGTGDTLILDDARGKIFVNPDEKTIKRYEAQLQSQNAGNDTLLHSKEELGHFIWTQDGKQIDIGANIGFSGETRLINRVDAAFVGLYRTEMGVLSADNADIPKEEKWYRIFRAVMDGLNGKTCMARTVDFEGDKGGNGLSTLSPEEKEKIVRHQMRAALRIAADYEHEDAKNKFRLMIPNVLNKADFHRFQNMMDEEAGKLFDERGLDIKPLRLATMIEKLSIIDDLPDASEYSVGSNDLSAEILGFNRFGKEANKRYDFTDPRVLGTMEKIVRKVPEGKPLSVCGDMASTARGLVLLIGLGYRKFSVAASFVPVAEEIRRRIDTEQGKLLADEVLRMTDRAEREEEIDRFLKDCLGMNPDGTFDMEWSMENCPVYNVSHRANLPRPRDHS